MDLKIKKIRDITIIWSWFSIKKSWSHWWSWKKYFFHHNY